MADLCPTCGIRLDDGLCQCPEVLLAEVEKLRGALDYVASVRVASRCCHCDQRFSAFSLLEWSEERSRRVSVEIKGHDATCPANPALQQVRSLRAKLMRERANTHEWVASMVDDGYIAATEQTEAKSRSYHARARRLRAEAERIEGGGR
jgi:hypothetical protein